MLRRFAFRYSESTYAHWVPLVLADRINVIEGRIDDIKHGIIPNPFAERGWAAEWKYNRKSFVTKVAIGAAIAAAVVVVMKQKGEAKRSLT
jgi:hypothetical protein